jgi:hypothetical protein
MPRLPYDGPLLDAVADGGGGQPGAQAVPAEIPRLKHRPAA